MRDGARQITSDTWTWMAFVVIPPVAQAQKAAALDQTRNCVVLRKTDRLRSYAGIRHTDDHTQVTLDPIVKLEGT